MRSESSRVIPSVNGWPHSPFALGRRLLRRLSPYQRGFFAVHFSHVLSLAVDQRLRLPRPGSILQIMLHLVISRLLGRVPSLMENNAGLRYLTIKSLSVLRT